MQTPKNNLTKHHAPDGCFPLVRDRVTGKQAANREAMKERGLPQCEVLFDAIHGSGLSRFHAERIIGEALKEPFLSFFEDSRA
jgi:hypothetical protein